MKFSNETDEEKHRSGDVAKDEEVEEKFEELEGIGGLHSAEELNQLEDSQESIHLKQRLRVTRR